MKSVKFKIVFVFMLFAFVLCGCNKKSSDSSGVNYSTEELFNLAVKNCESVDENEIKPLVAIKSKEEDKLVTWNETGDKVLLVTWHHFPSSYPEGEEITISWSDGWMFSDKEIKSWYSKNNKNVSDWTLRLEQVLGVQQNKGHTHFTAYWANPSDVFRPAYNPDITKQISKSDLDGSALGEDGEGSVKAWFYSQKDWAKGKAAWTALGYTCDWGYPKKTYGLTEFIVKKGSTVKVEWTKTNDEFMEWLKK